MPTPSWLLQFHNNFHLLRSPLIMARFFSSRNQSSSERHDVETTVVKKNKFSLFRRGRAEMPGCNIPPEPERVSSQRKTQSYRISVYEVRSESPTTTCSSTDVSDTARRDATVSSSSSRSKTPVRRRSVSPMKQKRSKGPSQGNVKTETRVEAAPPQRTFSEPTAERRASPRRGILKRGSYSMVETKSLATKPQPVASFDLELARATSLTDNMSSDSPEDAVAAAVMVRENKNKNYPLGTRDDSFLIQPKRTVSFSKDVRDPKPQPSGVASLCLGTSSGRRVVSGKIWLVFTHMFDLQKHMFAHEKTWILCSFAADRTFRYFTNLKICATI